MLTLTGVPSEALQSWQAKCGPRARPVEAQLTRTLVGLHWQHRPSVLGAGREASDAATLGTGWQPVRGAVRFGEFCPASWLAQALASATGNHVLLTDTRGTIWSGSGVLVLTGGDGSRDAASLPGRIAWRTGP